MFCVKERQYHLNALFLSIMFLRISIKNNSVYIFTESLVIVHFRFTDDTELQKNIDLV